MSNEAFWDSRAELGDEAGTQDLIAKEIEDNFLLGWMRDGIRILDVGCGNGTLARKIVERHECVVFGIDSSKRMAASAAKRVLSPSVAGKKGIAWFLPMDLFDLNPDSVGRFDVVLTQRTLINLPSIDQQIQAIKKLLGLVLPGGTYLMLENSIQGVMKINRFRGFLGLPPISPPKHNCYIDEDVLLSRLGEVKDGFLEGIHKYSGTYYFLSRVINAWVAKKQGRDPEYLSLINQLGLHLQMGELRSFSQGRLYLWRRL